MTQRRVAVLVLLCLSCAGPRGTYVTPTELDRMQAASMPEPPAPGELPVADGPDLADEDLKARDDLDRRRIELSREREDHAAELEKLESKWSQGDLERKSALADETQGTEAAARAQRQADQDLALFLAEGRELAVRESALDLQRQGDNLLEAREELAQLEIMYGETELGEATAEIVLERTRRRLRRAEESHALSEVEHRHVLEVELPRREEDLRGAVQAKAVALENAQRALAKGELARAQALRELELEQHKLTRGQEDLTRDEALLVRDQARHEQKVARRAALGP